jgi:ribosomal protein S14
VCTDQYGRDRPRSRASRCSHRDGRAALCSSPLSMSRIPWRELTSRKAIQDFLGVNIDNRPRTD